MQLMCHELNSVLFVLNSTADTDTKQTYRNLDVVLDP